ncbi:MFS transporter [Asanoa ishikariensis]|uniref:Predicted arabinose efflux permease, MFS family n=1 Tax=Asanoa ishikariensis TaxID=137265 RepID=A0A1H3P1F5_9ACTN|nr:MFS transporter [Asanoa ishikariensis]GIF68208.1 MFS transporter [Asanoa ishikariensis]SDY94625.1 Predicted arabinose efflux permease, MFS family [Asanoa ishikariensis]
MSRRLTFLFAVAAGVAIGNLYWAQPLLDLVADDLHASPSRAGWLITATQVGYAVGVLLIVPLGDVVDRRRLVPGMLLCSSVALLLCAVAPTMGVLLAAIALLGLTTVAGQILTPLAGDLASPTQRGEVVGKVGSGILTGILAARTISGLVAGSAGWRTIYVCAAVVVVLLAALLFRALPPLAPKTALPYPALIASVATVALRERAVRWTLVLGATGFAVFAMFWTALTFRLSSPPFDYSATVIGLFGLAGLSGVLAGQRGGRLHDRGWSLPATGAAWLLALLSFVLVGLAGRSIVLLVVGIVALDAALQTASLLNRARLFDISHDARSRINTAFVVSNFIGGGLGSAAATVLWSAGGWPAITTAGIALSGLALTVWAAGRRGALVTLSHA